MKFVLFGLMLVSCNAVFGKGYIKKVLVYKELRKMELIRNDSVIHTFRISLGFEPEGHKMQEGDGKTPEGDYILDFRNKNSKFYKSIHISYPNESDWLSAKERNVKPGGDIMIHGLKNGYGWLGKAHLASDWTNGCIAVTNDEMDIIWEKVRDGTPIEIRK